MPELATLLPPFVRVIDAAGRVVMAIYARNFAAAIKDDASPVTEADQLAEALILNHLRTLTPEWPVVAEESVASGEIPAIAEHFWLVAPLDGTKEFIRRNGEFTVNIALIERGRPVLGLVLAPAKDRLFYAASGAGAFLREAGQTRPIVCRRPPPEGLTVVASRSHGDPQALQAFLGGRPVAELKTAGSSLKLCLIAAGEADMYPRLVRTMEWDIAAGHAVLSVAGDEVCDLAGVALRYGKPGFDNPHFLACGLR